MAGLMAHSPADVLRRALIALGLGADPPAVPWPIYAAVEPSTPDNVITVSDTMGRVDLSTSVDQDRSEMHGFSIRVRSVTHIVGWVKANAVAVTLDRYLNNYTVTIGAAVYKILCASRTGTVMAIGLDTSTTKRDIFTVNGLITVRQTAP